MSREVLGDAPVLEDTGDDSGPSTSAPSVRNLSVNGVRPPSGSTAVLVLAVLVLIAAGGGWLWYDRRSAGTTGSADGTVAGVFSGYSVGADSETPLRARLAIVVINSGPGDVVITADIDDGSRTGSFTLSPSSATVRAGASVPVNADVTLDCGRSPALELPPLRMDLVGRQQRDLPVVGVFSTVFRLCAEGALTSRPVTVTAERVEGTRLVLDLAAPTGQPMQIDVVRAGGIPLSIGGQPVRLGHAGTKLVLYPYATCQDSWRTTGVPRFLSLDVSSGPDSRYPSSIRLQSSLLSDWILDGACGAQGG